MLSITPTVNVFLAIDPVDMRKGFHGLTSLTESILRENPLSGHWFVFINRRHDRVKILTWDGNDTRCQTSRAKQKQKPCRQPNCQTRSSRAIR